MENEHPRITHNLRNDIRDLQKSSNRESEQMFVAEGLHLCQELAHSHHKPQIVVLRSDASPQTLALAMHFADTGSSVYTCSTSEMDRMSDATSPQSMLAVVPFFAEAQPTDRIIVLDAVSDPGNVGTIVRCAKWFGFTDVVLSDGCADMYNPKTMRATAGAAFGINVVRRADVFQLLSGSLSMPIVATLPTGGESPSILNTLNQFAIVIGSEAHGISHDVLSRCTRSVTIPGGNGVESLNAAVSAAILCYEARM